MRISNNKYKEYISYGMSHLMYSIVLVLFHSSDKYGLKVSDVQLPDSLEDNPYIIIKPKHYVSSVLMSLCDVMSRSHDLLLSLGSVGTC